MQEDIEMDSNAMAATTQVWLNYCRLECRSCRRRLYEELLKPILDHPPLPLAARCSLRREIIEERQTAAKVRLHCEIWVQYEQDYLSDIERALVKHIRTTVLPMYRVMGVCQALAESEHYKRSSNRLYVCARDFEPVYHSPRLRTHGIAVRSYPNRVMLEVIAGTRLMNLRALFSGEAPTTILLADDVRDIRAIVNEAAKLRHIRLLACVCDDRILSASEARAFADLTDPDTLPSVTVALLGDTPQRTVSLLQSQTHALVASLDAHVLQLKPDGGDLK